MKMNNRLEYRKVYFLRVDLENRKIRRRCIYLGINHDTGDHVILTRDEIFGELWTSEFIDYTLKNGLRIKKLILNSEEANFRDDDRGLFNLLDKKERIFAEEMYVKPNKI